MPKATLAFLSYERPKFIEQAVTTAIHNAGTNDFEVIVHDDGSTSYEVDRTIDWLRDQFDIEKVILKQKGVNEGVGKAIDTCKKLAEGDYFFKLDQDLIFEQDWLQDALYLLENYDEIGLLGLFHYYHDPVDTRKTFIEEHGDYQSHTHICGSGFGIKLRTLYEYGIETHSEAYAEDWDLMKRIHEIGDQCNALPLHDLATNQGFGIGPSTVVMEDGSVRPINKGLKERV